MFNSENVSMIEQTHMATQKIHKALKNMYVYSGRIQNDNLMYNFEF